VASRWQESDSNQRGRTMAAERLSMRKIKEVLRLRARGHSKRAIALSLNISDSTVRRYVERAEGAGLKWPLPPELGDRALEEELFPPRPRADGFRPLPDFTVLHRELRRKSVTLQLLWLEYKEAHPDGYQYTQFCRHYRRWRDQLDPVLRQTHGAGEKAFVDYAGQTVDVIDRETGEVRSAQIFVGTLGASNYTGRRACPTGPPRTSACSSTSAVFPGPSCRTT